MKTSAIFISKVTALSLILAWATSCEKVNCEREEPQLNFDTMFVEYGSTDVLIYRTKFEDCQGDIGELEGVNGESEVRTYIFELIDGSWERYYPDSLTDTVLSYSVIPGSLKNREGWLLKGTVIQDFQLASLRQNSDTIRFHTTITDRAGNRSNRVVSPTFVFPD